MKALVQRGSSSVLAFLVVVAWTGEITAEESGASVPGPRITFHEDPQGVRGVKLKMYLKTDPDRVWALVTDSKRAPALFKNVAAIKASAKGPSYSDYHISSSIGDKVVTCLVKRDDGRRHLTWRRVEGSLETLYGYFKIGRDERYPNHVQLEYGSFIDPGGIGRVLMTNRRRQAAVEYMITKLRGLVERS